MILKPQDIQTFLKNPTETPILLYGPNTGKISEIGKYLSKKFSGTCYTFFQEDLSEENFLSHYEQQASLFSDKKTIRLKNATDKSTKLLKFLQEYSGTTKTLIEAGDLAASSSLRKLFDSQKKWIAIPCYLLEDADKEKAIQDFINHHKKTLSWQAKQKLKDFLDNDSLSVKQDLKKLSLYSKNLTEITEQDLDAVFCSEKDLSLDELINSIAEGNKEKLISVFVSSRHQESPIGLLRLCQKHFQKILDFSYQQESGIDPETILSTAKPPIFYKNKPHIKKQLSLWNSASLEKALGKLIETELLCKTSGVPDKALTEHVFLELCAIAGKK